MRNSPSMSILHKVQNQRQHHKYCGKPFGGSCKLRVKGLALILQQEGVGIAGNSSGKAGTLAALEKNHKYYKKTGYKLNNSNGYLQKNQSFQEKRSAFAARIYMLS